MSRRYGSTRERGTVTRWTEKEDAIIRELAGVVSAREIASQLPGRSTQSVGRRIRALGLDGRLYGQAHHNAKIDNLQRSMIITLKEAGFTATEIKKAFGLTITRSTINDIGHRR